MSGLQLTIIGQEPFQAIDGRGRSYLLHGDSIVFNELLPRHPDDDALTAARLCQHIFEIGPSGREAMETAAIGETVTLSGWPAPADAGGEP